MTLPTTAWQAPPTRLQPFIARSVALAAQFALLLGMVLIGAYHFESIQTAMAAAVLYLLLPYIGQMGGRIDHAVPGALLVWAMLAYRRPVVSGFLLGLAGGLVFYPLFLVPLGCSFYWQRGLRRYLVGTALGIAVLVVLAVVIAGPPGSRESFLGQLRQMFGGTLYSNSRDSVDGIVGFLGRPTSRPIAFRCWRFSSSSVGAWPCGRPRRISAPC